MKTYEFDAVMMKHPTLNSAYIEFPYDVEAEFGKKGQVKVLALIDGYEYRGSLAKMGRPCHFLGITQEVRKAIGKEPGDTVHVVIRQDTEPRVVEVPDDLTSLLDADDSVTGLGSRVEGPGPFPPSSAPVFIEIRSFHALGSTPNVCRRNCSKIPHENHLGRQNILARSRVNSGNSGCVKLSPSSPTATRA